jgi:predicted metal-dependent hydrolase
MDIIQKEATVGDKKISYIFRQSSRAKRMRLTVRPDGAVLLTVPVRFSKFAAEQFLVEKAEWVISKLDHFSSLPPVAPILHHGRRDYLKHKEVARGVITAKIEQFGQLYGYSCGNISVKNQRSCWGSCSRKGNLNFNYKILFLPESLQNYIIVHELCHLRELNHSPKFWQLVAQTIPDHKVIRKELRSSGLSFR